MFTPTSEAGRYGSKTATVMLYFRAILVIGMLGYLINKQQANENKAEEQRQVDKSNHEEAVAGRKQIIAMEQNNEKMIREHIQNALERWKRLGQNNPDLVIKPVPEPEPILTP